MSDTARMAERERKIRAQEEQLRELYTRLYPSFAAERIAEMALAEATYLVTERDAIQREDALCDSEPR